MTPQITSSHLLSFCNEVKRILQVQLEDGDTCESRLCFLSSVLQNQGKGKPGAGLTGGIFQESLWKDMFFSQSPDRFSEPEEKDADYCFDGIPFSHKTIGWRGNGALALAWSKNPASGLQRTQFNSSMVIACTKQPKARGLWEGIQMGLYVIPVDWLKDNVVLSSNNKTDSLIEAKYTIQGLRYACDAGLHVALHYDHSAGEDHSLSFWTAGRSAAVRSRSADESHPSTLFPPHQ
jgi:hypothetical protein